MLSQYTVLARKEPPHHTTPQKHKYINGIKLNLLATLFLVVVDKIRANNQRLSGWTLGKDSSQGHPIAQEQVPQRG